MCGAACLPVVLPPRNDESRLGFAASPFCLGAGSPWAESRRRRRGIFCIARDFFARRPLEVLCVSFRRRHCRHFETRYVQMSSNKKRSIRANMRILHRYIGFFLIGFTVVFSLSGIVLVYRDTDFLKSETRVEKTVAPNLEAGELGKALHLRKLKVTGNEGDSILFEGGRYNKETGVAVYTEKKLPFLLEKCGGLHKSPARPPRTGSLSFSGRSFSSWQSPRSGCMSPDRGISERTWPSPSTGLAAAIAVLLVS